MFLLSTSCLRGYSLHRIFSICRESGYDGLDIEVSFKEFDTYDAEYLNSLIVESGVLVKSMTAPMAGITQERVDDMLEAASAAGVEYVTFSPPRRIERKLEWFTQYLPRIKDKYPQIHICTMNVEPKTFLFIIPEYKDANVGNLKKITGETALNVSHVDISSGVDLLKTYSLLGNTIRNVYISDTQGPKKFLFPGTGQMPIESLLIKLKENAYKYAFTLRVDPHEIDAGKDKDAILKKLTRAKSFFDRYFR